LEEFQFEIGFEADCPMSAFGRFETFAKWELAGVILYKYMRNEVNQ
jgi:hypothetical protein